VVSCVVIDLSWLVGFLVDVWSVAFIGRYAKKHKALFCSQLRLYHT